MSEQTQIDQPEEKIATEQAEQVEKVEVPQTEETTQEAERKDTEQEELAAIMAGYSKPAANQQKEEEAPAQAMHLIAGFQEDELAAKLQKVDKLEADLKERWQKVNNMVGNLKQRLDALPKEAQKTEARAITSESMKKMRELGFDEIADALAEDLNGAFSVQSQPTVDIQGAVAGFIKQRAFEELSDVHPDWQQIVTVDADGNYQNSEFAEWFNSLESNTQTKVRESNSVAFATRALDTFKGWKKEKQSHTETVRKTSESRLKNAVTPTQGKAAATPSRLPDDAGLWAGYNKGPKPLRRN